MAKRERLSPVSCRQASATENATNIHFAEDFCGFAILESPLPPTSFVRSACFQSVALARRGSTHQHEPSATVEHTTLNGFSGRKVARHTHPIAFNDATQLEWQSKRYTTNTIDRVATVSQQLNVRGSTACNSEQGANQPRQTAAEKHELNSIPAPAPASFSFSCAIAVSVSFATVELLTLVATAEAAFAAAP